MMTPESIRYVTTDELRAIGRGDLDTELNEIVVASSDMGEWRTRLRHLRHRAAELKKELRRAGTESHRNECRGILARLEQRLKDHIAKKPRTGLFHHLFGRPEAAASRPESQAFVDSLALLAHPYLTNTFFHHFEKFPHYFEDAKTFTDKFKLSSLWNKIVRRMTPDMSKVEEHLAELGELLKDPKIVNDPTISRTDLDFIRAWRIYMVLGSDNSANQLRRLVGIVASPDVAAEFAGDGSIDAGGQQDASGRSQALVKKMIGADRPKLTMDEGRRLSAAKNPHYSEYLAVRREVTKYATDAINNMTRGAGKPVAVSTLIADLNRHGIEHNLPRGFNGLKDEKGWYTVYGELLNTPPIGDVLMNPAYTQGSEMYYCKSKAFGAKTWQWNFTAATKKARRDEKFESVKTLTDNLDKYQAIWHRDMMGHDASYRELATMTELLFYTASRIGTPGNETDGNATYGITTIFGHHVEFKGNRARIHYQQKKGSLMTHILEPHDKWMRMAINTLKEYVQRAGPNGKVFTKDAKDQRDYLRTRLKMPIGVGHGAHIIRTLRGTALMKEELAKQRAAIGKKPTEKQVNDAIKAASEVVGELLGHNTKGADGAQKVTGTVALTSYVDDAVSKSWFEEFGYRIPRWLEKLK